ncbi:MAG TPA: type II toxin-antitoxin system HicB family antitoxin [Gemmataceae bacterium]|nr:type II toxin-antitoxin system HicB family antitoxin [Gemmataceae bacterium]
MRYLVKIYHYNGSYSAMAPDLPGCVAAAKTVEKVRTLMADAMALHLNALRKSGDKVPKPRKRVQLDADDFEDEEICTWIEVKEQRPRRRTTASATRG